MALLLQVTVILATFIFAIAILAFSKNGTRKNSRKIPPGSNGLPLIGETISFSRSHSLNSVGEYMQSRLSRFGNVFSTRLFGAPSIISANPKLNRLVLNNDVLFGSGSSYASKQVFGDAMALLSGDVHKHMRMTILDFLHPERMRSLFFQDADTLASELISSWKDAHAISVKEESTKFSLRIMAKKLLSMTADDDIKKLATQYGSVARVFTSLPLYFPGTAYWKAIHAREILFKMFKQEIAARRRTECNDAGKDDFLAWLMKNTDYSEERICEFLLGVLFAGHDTTARAICLLIYYLESCPKAVSKLREEHNEVLESKQRGGESKLTWDDYKKMEFTKCVINETLRLGNITRFIGRKAAENVEFEDYLIPQGCRVIIHFGAVHLDPSLYEDPTKFNPWRWLSSSGVKNYDSFMPFSKGAHMCPGADLAKMEMTIFLHHLIMKYDWELAEPDHPIASPFPEFPKDLPIKIRAIYKDTNA